MTDDPTRTRLAAADPAAGLPPLGSGARAALLDRAARSARPAPRRRLPIVLGGLVAAAAITAVVLVLPRPAAGPVVTVQAAASDPTALCAPLADFAVPALRASDLALSGTVTASSGTTAAIAPDRVYRGAAVGLLRLRTDTAGGPALDGPVLREGERVLIAATDGQVAACGLSAAESPALLRLYEQAFD